MDPKLTRDTAARVVAWHNRHPLARRIRPEQVGGVGVVGLPFTPRASDPPGPTQGGQAAAEAAGPAGSSGRLAGLRQRLGGLWQRLRRAGPPAPSPWQAAFDEPFLPGFELAPTQAWVEAHAVDDRPGSEDAPQRLVPPREALLAQDLAAGVEAALAGNETEADGSGGFTPWTQRWVLSAAIDSGGARHRLLLAPDAPKAVLGRRALAPGRIAGATALLAGLLMLAVLAPWLGGGRSAHGGAHAAAAASSSASSAGSAPASAPLAGHAQAAAQASSAASSAPSSAAADATAHAAHAEATASGPTRDAVQVDAAAHGAASSPLPHGLTAAASAVDTASDATPPTPAPAAARPDRHEAPHEPPRHEQPGPKPAPLRPLPTAPADRPAPGLAPQPLPAKGPVFALATRPSPVRAEAEALRRRMEAAAATLAGSLPGTQVELLQRGERWSAVWWPFASREAATQGRWALALKGVTVEVVEF